jgi:hypothetical protein
MRESEAMLEIRRIRDENSLRHLNMTSEEINREYDEIIKWYVEQERQAGKEVKVVSHKKSKNEEAIAV